MPKTQLVLASHNESLDWISNLDRSRRGSLDFHIVHSSASGGGQEAGAYAQWILDNWTLDYDTVVFSQADPFVHGVTKDFQQWLWEVVDCPPEFFRALHDTPTNRYDSMVKRVQSLARNPLVKYSDAPIKDACRYLWNSDCPVNWMGTYGGILATRGRCIREYPLTFWAKFHRWVAHEQKTFECGLMEKMWRLFFDPECWTRISPPWAQYQTKEVQSETI